MKTETLTPELEAAFAAFKRSAGNEIFAESISEMCEAEVRMVHACSNASDSASTLAKALEAPTPVKSYDFDQENGLELFSDDSLYMRSSADSEVWMSAWDFQAERYSDEVLLPGLRAFFGEDDPEEPTEFRVAEVRHYYGPLDKEDWVCDDHSEPLTFATREEAQAWITERESGTYYLGHNEHSRPTYTAAAC